MVTCSKNKLIAFIILIILNLTLNNIPTYAQESFSSIKEKKISYIDFLLLKFENKLINRRQILMNQMFATRVQYSSVGVGVEYDEKEEEIIINIVAVMDKNRYRKKKYEQKISDCNIVRNLIFYNKTGYKFFTQKRNSILTTSRMKTVFKEVFFKNLSINQKEIDFLINNMFVKVKVIHPINKTELMCSGQVNDSELK